MALSNWATSLSQIGVALNVIGLSPAALRTELDKWLADRIAPKTLESIVDDAPAVQVARANVRQAEAAAGPGET